MTADPITDDQIRTLLEQGEITLAQFHQATSDIVGWVDEKYQRTRRAARARCAETRIARRWGE